MNGDEYSGWTWLDSGTPPTESEIDAEVTRLNNEELMRLLRIERNKRLSSQIDSPDITLSNDTNWKQALRDLPASAHLN